MVSWDWLRSAMVTKTLPELIVSPTELLTVRTVPEMGAYRLVYARLFWAVCRLSLAWLSAFRPVPVALAGTVPPVTAVTKFCASVTWAVSSATLALADANVNGLDFAAAAL